MAIEIWLMNTSRSVGKHELIKIELLFELQLLRYPYPFNPKSYGISKGED